MALNNVRREAFIYYKEESQHLMSYHVIAQIVERKQKQTLTRFFLIPFWEAFGATLILLAILLFLSQAWIFTSSIGFVAGFSIFMSRRCRNSLKQIKIELDRLEQTDMPSLTGGTMELASQGTSLGTAEVSFEHLKGLSRVLNGHSR